MRLAILGASGHGRVCADIALLSEWTEVVFFDDAHRKINRIGPWPIAGGTPDLISMMDGFDSAFVAIGNNQVRHEKISLLKSQNISLATLVHPKAIVSPYASLDHGVLLAGGVVVNPFARVSIGVIVNTGATIGHDVCLHEAVHVAPGCNIAGNVEVGARSWVGIGSAIKQGVKIGSDVMVGAGAAVVDDVMDGVTVVGVPAKPLKRNCDA